MKKLVATVLAVMSPLAYSGTFTDYAEVYSVYPIREMYSVPTEHCRNEIVTREHRSVGGPLIGAITGGVVGHQFGKGSGRDAATVIGALTGAVVGDRMSDPAYREEKVRRCTTEYEQRERITGYSVTYRYGGRTFSEVMREDPGKEVTLSVTATPVR